MGRSPKFLVAVLAAVAMSLAGASAEAATFILDYTANAGAPAEASLTLETADDLNAVGGYDVLSITGHVDSDEITGIIANPSQPNAWYTPSGLFIVDNVFSPGAMPISNWGIFFQGASGNEYNLFSDNPTTYELYRAQSAVGYLANSVGTLATHEVLQGGGFNVEGGGLGGGAVPEPSVWTMMIGGFGLAGALIRRKRRLAD